ncbi:MAG: hypothetical protein MZU91_02205 [Desulfosudis oleivorans]|nr:hypothetical protein [Desulfosudis oleivorans]
MNDFAWCFIPLYDDSSGNKLFISFSPDTLLRWHRELFQFYWRRKSQGRPKISPETIALIQELGKRIGYGERSGSGGELLKLGIEVSKRTIQRYMPKVRKEHPSSQNWVTFLKNQASGIWACDFMAVTDWLFRQWYVFVVMRVGQVLTCYG